MCTPEALLPIFADFLSNDMDKNNSASKQILEYRAQSPLDLLLSASAISLDNEMSQNYVHIALTIITSILKPSTMQSQNEIKDFWNSILDDQRETIRNALIHGLMYSNASTRSISAKALGYLFTFAIPYNERNAVFPLLHELFTNTESYGEYAKFGVISVMNTIFELKSFIVKAHPNYLTDVDVTIQCCLAILQLNPKTDNENLNFAFQCIYNCAVNYQERKTDIFEDNERAHTIYNLIFSFFNIDDTELHKTLYDLLFLLLKDKYEESATIFSEIFEVISVDFQHNNELIVKQCIDFWDAFCSFESRIVSTLENPPNYIRQVYESIVGELLNWLSQDYEDEESREDKSLFHKALEAQKLIESFGKFLPEEILPMLVNFFSTNISSPEWRFIQASLLAIRAALNIAKKDAEELLNFYDGIIFLCEHENSAVRETSLLLLSELIVTFPKKLEPNFESCIALAINHLSRNARDAAYSCVLISKILQNSTYSYEQYENLIETLFNLIDMDYIYKTPLNRAIVKVFSSLIDCISINLMNVDSSEAINRRSNILVGIFQGIVDRILRTTEINDPNVYNSIIFLLSQINSKICQSFVYSYDPVHSISYTEEMQISCQTAIEMVYPLFDINNPSVDILRIISDIVRAGKLVEVYEQLLPIFSQLIQTEEISTSNFACKLLSHMFIPEFVQITLPNVENFLQILATKSSDEYCTAQSFISITSLAASLIRICEEGSYFEYLVTFLEFSRNVYVNRLTMMTTSEYPDYIESVVSLDILFVRSANKNYDPSVYKPRLLKFMFDVIKLAEELPEIPTNIYSLVFLFLKTCAFSPALKQQVNVYLKQDYTKMYVNSKAQEILIARNEKELAKFMKSFYSKLIKV